MRRKKTLEQYEAESQELLQLLAAARSSPERRAPADFQAQVLRKVARQPNRPGVWAWLGQIGTPAWVPALAIGLLLSLGVNVWLGLQTWLPHGPGKALLEKAVTTEPPRHAYASLSSIQSQTALGTLVAVHSPLEDRAVVLGFATPSRMTPYHVGMLYVEALATVQSHDFTRAAKRLTVLESALLYEQAPPFLIQYISTLRSLVEQSQVAASVPGVLLVPFEPWYASYAEQHGKDRLVLFRCGTWLSTMALAAAAGDSAALRQGELTAYCAQELPQLSVPKGVHEALARLQQLLTPPALTARDVQEVLSLVKKMQVLLG